MSTPRRPLGGRPTAGRRPARPAARAAARPAGLRRTRPQDRGPRLSLGRAAVLVLVVVTLTVSAALPLREWVSQRGQIDQVAQSNRETRARVAELQAERARLQDPAYVKGEARRRLHFVLPGEQAYILIEPPAAPAEVEQWDGPWWDRLWSSTREADRPGSGARPARQRSAATPVPAPDVPTVAPTPGPTGSPTP